MASRKLRKIYPNLAEYIDGNWRDPLLDKITQEYWSAMGGAMAGSVLAAIAASAGVTYLTNIWAGLGVGFFVWAGASIFSIRKINQRARAQREPKTHEEQLLRQSYAAVNQLRTLDSSKDLHRALDPVAGKLLEAGAYHYLRIVKALDSNAWKSTDIEGHWAALRQRTLDASRIAMAELTVLSVECVGDPTKKPQDDLKDIFEDFVELDFADAIQGLKDFTRSNIESYAYQSPNTRAMFPQGRALAERLQQLGDLVEENSQILAETTRLHTDASYATDSIDVLLGEFQAVKQAESELRHERLDAGQ